MYEEALIEVATCFGRHCQGEFDEPGRKHFLWMFYHHVVRGLSSRKAMTWEGNRQRVLDWTRDIALEAEQKRLGAAVTKKVLEDSATAKIPTWQQQCVAETETLGPFCGI